jgi:hypothetical protein
MQMAAAGEVLKYSGAVRVSLAKTPRLAGLLALATVVTVLLVVVTPLAAWAQAAELAAIAGVALEAWRVLVRRRGGRAVRWLRIDAGGAIEVADGEGLLREGRLAAGSFVAPWLTVVRWRPRGARFDRAILVLPGMAPQDELRALRVVLRWAECNPGIISR